jgi:outer membrane lipoprotein-sorting protein
MKKIHLVSLFILLSAVIPARANILPSDTAFRIMRDTNAFKQRMKNFGNTFNSLECNFVQKKSMQMLKKPVVSKGLFVYRKPSQVRWEYTEPFVYVIVISNNKITIKDETRTNQMDMTANTTFMEMNTRVTSMVDGSLLDNHGDFHVDFFENDLYFRLDLKPLTKELKKYFNSITLCFEKSDLSVASIKMYETGGDITELTFTAKQINKTISDERFIIK